MKLPGNRLLTLGLVAAMLAVAGCGTTGTNTAARRASNADYKKSLRTENALLEATSRIRHCGSAVSAAMGAAVAVAYYGLAVRQRIFKRNDHAMIGLARRAYRGEYRQSKVLCETAYGAIRDSYLLFIRNNPSMKNGMFRFAVALLRTDGEYDRFVARVRARRQAARARRRAPVNRHRRWEKVYQLPKNALDL